MWVSDMTGRGSYYLGISIGGSPMLQDCGSQLKEDCLSNWGVPLLPQSLGTLYMETPKTAVSCNRTPNPKKPKDSQIGPNPKP